MRAAHSVARVTPPVAPPMSRAVLRERLPGYVGQAVLLAVVAWLAWRGIANFEANARALGLSAGFGFLRTQAGFEIAQALIPFSPQSSYLDAIVVATLNTLLVVALAGVLSTLAGLCVAFGRVAPPGLVRGRRRRTSRCSGTSRCCCRSCSGTRRRSCCCRGSVTRCNSDQCCSTIAACRCRPGRSKPRRPSA